MNSWDFKSHDEILKGMADEGVELFDFSKIDDKIMQEFEETLQKLEMKARSDEAAAIIKASNMRLSL
jgi:predicted nucleic acid-binding protein